MQPPNNPYSNSSDFNPPVPGAPMPGGTPSRGPEISFDAIGQAWKILQPNIGQWIGAALIYGVISGLLNVLQGALTPKSANGVPQIGPLYFVFLLLGIVVGQFLLGGLWRMALANVRTGRAEIGQMFTAGDVLPNLILSAIVVGLASLVGFALCIVPGLLLTGLFLFVTPLIVDKRLGAMEAIGASFNALKPQMWMAMLFAIVVGLLAGIGFLACGLGALITAPLALITFAVTYNNFFGTGQSSFQPPMPPSAPIADPFR